MDSNFVPNQVFESSKVEKSIDFEKMSISIKNDKNEEHYDAN